MSTNNPFDPESMMGPEWRDQAAEIGLSSMKNWNAENAAGLNIGAEIMKGMPTPEALRLNTSAIANAVNITNSIKQVDLSGTVSALTELNRVSRQMLPASTFASALRLANDYQRSMEPVLASVRDFQDYGLKMYAAVEAIVPKLRYDDLAGTSAMVRQMMEFYDLQNKGILDAARIAAANPTIHANIQDFLESHPEVAPAVEETLRDDVLQHSEEGVEESTLSRIRRKLDSLPPEARQAAAFELLGQAWDAVAPHIGVPASGVSAVDQILGFLVLLASIGLFNLSAGDSGPEGDSGE